MLALAYDAALRREELCTLHAGDIQPAHRLVRIRAETSKSGQDRIVPYSETSGILLAAYLAHRRTLSRRRGALFLSESRRNYAQPITMWTWSKVVRRIADAAGLPRFTTHTLRHLCLSDLARAGWDLHEIARFAGHRNVSVTQQDIPPLGPGPGREARRRDGPDAAMAHRAARKATHEGGTAMRQTAPSIPFADVTRWQPPLPDIEFTGGDAL